MQSERFELRKPLLGIAETLAAIKEKRMKAYQKFKAEINNTKTYYKSTLYSYEQTEDLIRFYNKNKEEFKPLEFELNSPKNFKINTKSRVLYRKNLNETTFIKTISILEVFLVDLIRDIFIETKEPFKKQESKIELTHSEILSIKTTASLYHKIISKECRKLSSGGFSDIAKYYKKHFSTDFSNFHPGRSKMEEYHDRRHLLVHRLGKTDEQFRKKYNLKSLRISIEEEYLFECFEDFLKFSELLENQVKYKLKKELKSKENRIKVKDKRIQIDIKILKKHPVFLEPKYEFWAGEEFTMVESILEKKEHLNQNELILYLSGTEGQIISFSNIVRKAIIEKKISANFTKIKEPINIQISKPRFLDDKLLDKIKHKLPEQPWETGIHKKIANELNLSNKLVSIAIQQLIGKGYFKNQINGNILNPE